MSPLQRSLYCCGGLYQRTSGPSFSELKFRDKQNCSPTAAIISGLIDRRLAHENQWRGVGLRCLRGGRGPTYFSYLLHLTKGKSTSLCKGEFIVIGNIIDSNLNIFFPWAFLVCISLGVAPRIVNLIVCHRNSIVDILLVLTTVPVLRARDL